MTTAARCRTSTSPRARPSPARSRTASAARSSSSRTPCPTTRRTSRSRPAAGSARQLRARRRPRRDPVDTRTFDDVVPGSGYSLAETVPAGWDQTSATCDDGSRVANIAVSAGETVTCTFTNHKRGQIVVVKDATPNDAQDFSFTAGGGLSARPASQLDDDSDATLSNTRTFAERRCRGPATRSPRRCRAAGTRSARPATTAARCRTSTVAPGETVTCTFTNRKRGQIVVVKDATPDDPQDFAFTAGGGLSPSSFQLDDDADPTLRTRSTFATSCRQPGYSIAETVPSGWDQTSATCSDGSPVSNIDVRRARPSPAPSRTASAAGLDRGQGRGPQRRRRTSASPPAAGSQPASFSLDDDSDGTLSNTPHVRRRAAGQRLLVCRDRARAAGTRRARPVTTAARCRTSRCPPGETVTCTFTNRKRGQDRGRQGRDARRPAGLRLHGRRRPQPRELPARRRRRPDAVEHAHVHRRARRAAATRSPRPSRRAGTRPRATCDDGSPVSNIDVAPGETVTCTFTNRKRGQIVVAKDATPNDPQDFAFTAGGGLSPSSFPSTTTPTRRCRTRARSTNVRRPAPATRVAETVPGGWDQTSATCDDGSPVSNIDVSRR